MASTSTQSGEWGGRDGDPRPSTRSRLFKHWSMRVLVSAVGWTIAGVIFALPSLMTTHWMQSLRMSLAEFWAWGFIAPLVVALDRRLPFSGRQLSKRVGAHLAASVAFTTLYLYIFTVIRAAMAVAPWSSLEPAQVFSFANLGWFLWSWLICGLIVGAVQAYQYYERYMSSELRLERLEHSVAEARLNALRMQLDPHFLFNALNTISSHVERDPKLTRRMIEHLGDLLRLSLESKDKQEVPLAEEISFLDHYLAIQKIRFGSQLRIRLQIDPEVRLASVPSLVIQPLVENAIRHGISRRAAGGIVTVEAARDDGRLVIRVLDDGVGLPPGWSMENAAGLGLSITRERILGLHPNGAAKFEVRNRAEGGAAVEISLPLRFAGEQDHGRAAD